MSKPAIRVLPSAVASHEAMLEVLAWARHIDFAYAWMSTAAGQLEPWHALEDSKIRRGIVGLSFARTDPDVLHHLRRAVGPTRFRVIDDESGAFTFHPKVLVAARGSVRRAIVGSSNFTRGGFARNTELNLLLEGSATDPVFVDLEAVIDSYWKRAEPMTSKRLEAYRKAHEAARRRDRAMQSISRPRGVAGHRTRRKDDTTLTEQLNVPWDAYAAGLWERLRYWTKIGRRNGFLGRGETAYLSQIAKVRELLDGRSLRTLSLEDARKVVGITAEFRWFGNTGSKWSFARLIRDDKPEVARLIDSIPGGGDVSDAKIRRIFHKAKGHPAFGISTLTRILCAKRPDLFISVNSANRSGMRKALGLAPTTMDKDEYLELLRRIRALPWFDPTKRPKHDSVPHERELWDARVALLDAFFYEI